MNDYILYALYVLMALSFTFAVVVTFMWWGKEQYLRGRIDALNEIRADLRAASEGDVK